MVVQEHHTGKKSYNLMMVLFHTHTNVKFLRAFVRLLHNDTSR